MPTTSPLDLASRYPQNLRIGDGMHAGAGELSIFPVFGRPSTLPFVSFAQGVTTGCTVHEREGGASVNDLVVHNPGPAPVLLYEGEEVLGAQQNRTFDVSVLVAAGSKLEVPVSCVEVGRWDGSRHSEAFAPSPQTAYPSLRRAKHATVRAAVAVGAPARANQREVWSEIADRQASLGVESSTGAMEDLFKERRDDQGRLTEPMSLQPEQIGALVFYGGEFGVLDLVARPEVFATLWEPLLEGYAMDAMGASLVAPVSTSRAEATAVVARMGSITATERPALGAAPELRFGGDGFAGAGLTLDEELIQLTAFPVTGSDTPAPPAQGRIRRPSRRGRR